MKSRETNFLAGEPKRSHTDRIGPNDQPPDTTVNRVIQDYFNSQLGIDLASERAVWGPFLQVAPALHSTGFLPLPILEGVKFPSCRRYTDWDKQPPHSRSRTDGDEFAGGGHRVDAQLNQRALADLAAWVLDLNLHNCREKRGGY